VPVVSPVNTQVTDDPVSDVEHAAGVVTDGEEVTVNPVRAEPPLMAGAAQVIVAEVAAAVATAFGEVGAPGVPTLIELEAADTAPLPLAFLAVTVNV